MPQRLPPQQRFLCVRSSSGFTLVELVIVLVLIGVLAAVAGTRFFSRQDVGTPAFRQELASAARYAQQLALATQCRVRFRADDATDTFVVEIEEDVATVAACDGDLASGTVLAARRPGALASADADLQGSEPGAITGGGAVAVTFDAYGRPDTGGSVPLGAQTLIIVAETGYVRLE